MRLPIVALFCALVVCAALPVSADSEVDPWQVADRLVESLGGRETWAAAKALYVRELAFPASLKEPVTAEFWRDLEKPAYRSLVVGPSIRREAVWSENGGWVIRNGVRSELSEETLREEILGWRQEPYVMYHKLALHDPSLELKLVDGNRLEIFDRANGDLLCWFVVDAAGALLRWGNYYQGDISEHIYGPLRDFGEVTMPAWGTSTTGSWRFEYQEVRPINDSSGSENR